MMRLALTVLLLVALSGIVSWDDRRRLSRGPLVPFKPRRTWEEHAAYFLGTAASVYALTWLWDGYGWWVVPAMLFATSFIVSVSNNHQRRRAARIEQERRDADR